MAKIDREQPQLTLDINVPPSKFGKHVFVIQYHNPSDRSNPMPREAIRVVVDVQNNNRTEAILPDCPYSFVCRAAVTHNTGEVVVFDTPQYSARIDLLAEKIPANQSLLIELVAAIPANEWSLDYVTPEFVCVMKDGSCNPSQFSPTSEALLVEFEKEQTAERTVTAEESELRLGSPQTSPPIYVWANDTNSNVDVNVDVLRSDRYKLIIHYSQNKHTSFDVDVTIQTDESKQVYSSVANIKYCPNLAGCRAIVHQRESNSSVFFFQDKFNVQLRSPAGKSVLFDYIMAIPLDMYDDAVMNLIPQEKALDFIKNCGANAFCNDPASTSDYCKKVIFSLTTEYNQGAFPCKCSTEGSRSFDCEPFGGQCPCKPNVIGRQCRECKTGYYGFPDCKPCSCPSTAYCHPRTGKCICPPRVTGEKCDKCMPFTFGYDEMLGCEECRCHRKGVLKIEGTNKANLQCNITTGQCPCKTNVHGRTCERCVPGFAYFPHCQLCNCDMRGVTEEMCNQDNGQCYCKDNVYGDHCEQCNPDAFFLEQANPLGCTKCFCFGTTDRCRSSMLARSQISFMSPDPEWKLVTIEEKTFEVTPLTSGQASLDLLRERAEGRIYSSEFYTSRGSLTPTPKNIFFSLPKAYLGRRITSYGGNFSYAIENILNFQDRKGSPLGFDVILVGYNLRIGYQQDEQPLNPNEPFYYNVTINERKFRHMNRNPVTREQIMMVLVNLEAIYVRGTYFYPVSETHLIDFKMDIAVEKEREDTSISSPQSVRSDDTSLALRVEKCFCPRNYKGTSCEECNDGYYRAQTGPYLGFCVPCQCNGHSEECDVKTGTCSNCKHNTFGDHCEFCNAGFYGEATHGTPHDCMVCPCPRPDISNNFATSCEISPDGLQVSCTCKTGYVEPRCDYCSAGYFGRPLELGDSCKPCQCNENIDPSNPKACDSITGLCVECLNSTFGPACELCAPGFYGDAIMRKDCKTCDCDTCGTARCNHSTGECICKPNVVGTLCDRCAPDHYGIQRNNTCNGCVACECAEASFSSSCDPLDGQCSCQPGVFGRTCDQCEPGYWQYSLNGCTSCNCGMKFSYGTGCNQETGQCQCLPGVLGKNCDSCPYRWVWIEKVGCKECDECVHFLLDDTDILQNMIDPMKNELNDASLSVFAFRRLNSLNKTADEYRAINSNLINNPPSVNLNRQKQTLQDSQNLATALDVNSTAIIRRSERVSDYANSTGKAAEEATTLVAEVSRLSNLLTNELKLLEESFGSPSLIQNIEAKVTETEAVLYSLKQVDLSANLSIAAAERDAVLMLQESINNFFFPATIIRKNLNETVDAAEQLNRLLNELLNSSSAAMAHAVDAQRLNLVATVSQEKITTDKEAAASNVPGVEKVLVEAKDKLDSSGQSIAQYKSQVHDVNLSARRLGEKKDELRVKLDQNKDLPTELRDRVNKATDHSMHLRTSARDLKNLFRPAKVSSESAVTAANRYDEIALSINDAIRMSNSAETAVKELEIRKDVTHQSVLDERDKSRNLLSESNTLINEKFLTQLLNPLANVTAVLEGHMSAYQALNAAHEKIKEDLNSLMTKEVKAISDSTRNTANIYSTDSEKITASITAIENNINEKAKEAKNIPNIYTEISNDVKQAHSYADRVAQMLPDLNNLTDKVDKKLPRIQKAQESLSKSVEELRQRVARAIGSANRIDLGVEFFEDTTLQLRNPDDLMTSGTYTKFGLAFRTKETDALLTYIGNPLSITPNRKRNVRQENQTEGGEPLPSEIGNEIPDQLIDEKKDPEEHSGTAHHDFMALEIREGKVVLTTDLGSGPETTASGVYVSNDIWHDVMVERMGKEVTLLVTGREQDIQVGRLTGVHNVFNLDPIKSKIYVGGVPRGVTVQKEVLNNKFVGNVSNVVFGDTPLGLWNFVQGTLNNKGATPKSMWAADQNSTQGLRFDGNSYAILPRDKFNFAKETYLQLKIKTYAKEGLIFLIRNDEGTDYLALFMVEGRIFVSYDLGSGYTLLSSKEGQIFNDGEWHSLDLNRYEKEAFIKIDNVQQEDAKSAIGIQGTLETNDNIYFGGFPGQHSYPEVTNVDFEGCISEVQISTRKVDLRANIDASPKVVVGCPATVSRTASFFNQTNGFIEMPLKKDINQLTVITMKYKTIERGPGLLFYVSNSDHSSFLAIYLNDMGQLIFRVKSNGTVDDPSDPPEEISVTTRQSYIGNSWHYLVATKDQAKVQLEVDDALDDVAKTVSLGKLSIFNKDKGVNVYFAGIPRDNAYILAGRLIPITYIGCFGDVTINNELQNFANAPRRPGASLASCPLADVGFSPTATEAPTGLKKGTDTSTLSPITTEEPPTEAPITNAGCALPVNPSRDRSAKLEDGLRFGNSHDTRHEFIVSSSVTSSLLDESNFSIEFKTGQSDGVIVYLAGSKYIDFVGLYMSEGKIHFSWNCGGGIGMIKTESSYNDNQWHKAVFGRKKKEGNLDMDDGKETLSATSPGDPSSLNVRSPIFVGGLSDEISKGSKSNLRGVISSFPGCLRNLHLQSVLQQFARDSIGYSTSECSSQVETGVFFGPKGGFLILKDKFRVGDRITIDMKIKPRSRTGIIMSVQGTKDFLTLQLIDGRVVFSVDNGAGPIVASYPEPPEPLCDGKWHSIQAVKEKNIVTLAIDEGNFEIGMGVGGVSSTDTNDPLFLGGIPEDEALTLGLEIRENFSGCIKDLQISSRPSSLAEAIVNGQVTLNTCPTY